LGFIKQNSIYDTSLQTDLACPGAMQKKPWILHAAVMANLILTMKLIYLLGVEDFGGRWDFSSMLQMW
jgi:hypothetical protein